MDQWHDSVKVDSSVHKFAYARLHWAKLMIDRAVSEKEWKLPSKATEMGIGKRRTHSWLLEDEV